MNREFEVIAYLREELLEQMKLADLEEGFELFRKRTVDGMNSSGEEIAATVSDTDAEHAVVLHKHFMTISHCQCGSMEYCKHIAAVFLQYLHAHGERPERFVAAAVDHHNDKLRVLDKKQKKVENRAHSGLQQLNQLNQSQVPKHTPASSSPTSASRVPNVPRAAERTKWPNGPKPDDSPESWHAWLEQAAPVMLAAPAHEWIWRVQKSTESLSGDWSSEHKAMLHWFSMLYILRGLEERVRQSLLRGREPVGFIHPAIESWMEGVMIQASLFAEWIDRTPAHAKYALAWIRDGALSGNNYEVNWEMVYGRVWLGLSSRFAWLMQERRELDQLRRHTQSVDQSFLVRIVKCEIALDLGEGRDEQAWKRWTAIPGRNEPDEWLPVLELFLEYRLWARAEFWLQRLYVHYAYPEAWPEGNCDRLLELTARFALDCGDDRMFLQAVERLLPDSKPLYEQYLLDSLQFEAYCDLQMAEGQDPSWDYFDSVLQRIEKEKPDGVLPWYHRGVETYLQRKNRTAYSEAIGLLLRIKRIYIRQSLRSRWEQYLRLLEDKYSRLRTFHDMLREAGVSK
ncbi:hypothetical protein [Paenibacillus koleovorans]|uniref:hypothetical protein n=1 Tax=Paenibacillus koleovorans TaxID=121608 RepID=UPI000FD8FD3B|nr:hypothetical protein [Paenibacillus koleovorans]